MQKGPIPLRVKKDDPLLTTTHRLIVAIGSQRFAMEMTTRCTELKPSPAEVITIDQHSKKKSQKPTRLPSRPRWAVLWPASTPVGAWYFWRASKRREALTPIL